MDRRRKPKLPAPPAPPPSRAQSPVVSEPDLDSDLPPSEITILAQHIRQAADYLVVHHHYSLKQLQNLSGGYAKDAHLPIIDPRTGKAKHLKLDGCLHKNSLMKIKDLRLGYVALLTPSQTKPGGGRVRKRWLPLDEGRTRLRGVQVRHQWMWNPQVDTFEKLERILTEALRLGFVINDHTTDGNGLERLADEARAA